MSHQVMELDLPHYSREPAWHKLGVVAQGRDLDRVEVRTALGADEWWAESVGGWIPYDPISGRPWVPHNGEAPPANMAWMRTEAKFNVRSDLPMSDVRSLLSPRGVGEGYELAQYESLLGIAEAAVGESGGTYDAAGTLENGKKGWVLVQLAKEMRVSNNGGSDQIATYLLVSSAHDGTRALTISPTAIRVVCWNTLSSAWAEADRRLHHTANIQERIGEVKAALSGANRAFGQLETTYNSMARKAIDDRFAAALLTALYPDPKPTTDNPKPSTARAERKRNEIFTLYRGAQAGSDGPGMMLNGQRTAYAMYNAITEHQSYLKVRRNGEGSDPAAARFTRNVMGTSDQVERERALDAILSGLDIASPSVDSIMDQIAV